MYHFHAGSDIIFHRCSSSEQFCLLWTKSHHMTCVSYISSDGQSYVYEVVTGSRFSTCSYLRVHWARNQTRTDMLDRYVKCRDVALLNNQCLKIQTYYEPKALDTKSCNSLYLCLHGYICTVESWYNRHTQNLVVLLSLHENSGWAFRTKSIFIRSNRHSTSKMYYIYILGKRKQSPYLECCHRSIMCHFFYKFTSLVVKTPDWVITTGCDHCNKM